MYFQYSYATQITIDYTNGRTMRILGIDSSTPVCSVALAHNGKVISDLVSAEQPSYSKHLLEMVDQTLAQGNVALNDVDGFAITIGPGSFTGLRVGVSLLKGFVLATEKPFVGINTLEALAGTVQSDELPVCAVLDARKREVYAAVFEKKKEEWKRILVEGAFAPEELCKNIYSPTFFVGSGAKRYRDMLTGKLADHFLEPLQQYSTAASAALMASRRFDLLKSFDLNQLKINYIRKSEAELSLGGSLAERRLNHGN